MPVGALISAREEKTPHRVETRSHSEKRFGAPAFGGGFFLPEQRGEHLKAIKLALQLKTSIVTLPHFQAELLVAQQGPLLI